MPDYTFTEGTQYRVTEVSQGNTKVTLEVYFGTPVTLRVGDYVHIKKVTT